MSDNLFFNVCSKKSVYNQTHKTNGALQNMDFVFERREIKYLLDEAQYIALLQKLAEREIMPDHYGKTTICNLYFDTPDFLLIRRSIEKPI